MGEIRIAIAGAGGRMGQANIRAAFEADGMAVVAAFDRADAPAIGKDAGTLAGIEPLGVEVTSDISAALAACDIVVDFTAPAASVALAARVAGLGKGHVIGTTGCTPDDDAAIAEAASQGARIVKAGNFSLGVNLLVALVRQAAKALGPDWDAEVLEMHHNRKVDAPSGTALMLGQAVADARGVDLQENATLAREGITGARPAGSIGFATLRGGGVIGEHSVILAGANERVTLSHAAQDRGLFAAGAVRAARWLADQPAGLYDMADVLGIRKDK